MRGIYFTLVTHKCIHTFLHKSLVEISLCNNKCVLVFSVCLDPLNPRLRFTSCVFVPFFFFFHAFWSNAITVHVRFIEQ